MKFNLIRNLIRGTLAAIAYMLGFAALSYAYVGIKFCIDGTYGTQQAFCHFVFLFCVLSFSPNDKRLDKQPRSR